MNTWTCSASYVMSNLRIIATFTVYAEQKGRLTLTSTRIFTQVFILDHIPTLHFLLSTWVLDINIMGVPDYVNYSKCPSILCRGITCVILQAKPGKTLHHCFKNNPTSACSRVFEILLDLFKISCVSFLWPKEWLFTLGVLCLHRLIDYGAFPVVQTQQVLVYTVYCSCLSLNEMVT